MADHGERSGVIEHLHLLKLAADHTVERVQDLLPAQLGRKGGWRAVPEREQLQPTGGTGGPDPESGGL